MRDNTYWNLEGQKFNANENYIELFCCRRAVVVVQEHQFLGKCTRQMAAACLFYFGSLFSSIIPLLLCIFQLFSKNASLLDSPYADLSKFRQSNLLLCKSCHRLSSIYNSVQCCSNILSFNGHNTCIQCISLFELLFPSLFHYCHCHSASYY